MTLGVHAFLVALERTHNNSVILSEARSAQSKDPDTFRPATAARTTPPSALAPCLCFAATLALNLLTKGLIGLVFPLAFVLLYLAITRQLRLLPRFHLIPSTAFFLAIALPWHILAAIRNPAIAMPSEPGLPARAGWAWFYLYNEHIARFLGKRIPHDYGQTPVWLFWLYAILWVMPWATFLPAALYQAWKKAGWTDSKLVPVLWSLIVLVFFTLSSRQEYYQLPALPALTLLIGAFLAQSEIRAPFIAPLSHAMSGSAEASIQSHRWLLLPIASLVAVTCAFFAVTAPQPPYGSDLSSLLSSNPALYNLSLGHIFDLTGAAMGFFRGPLIAVALGMIALGPVSYGFRRRRRAYAANLILAGGMTLVLLAAHEGLVRFKPILGSRDLALAIVDAQRENPRPDDLILLDGELTSGSTLLFYTRQPVHLVNGRINGPWFGSFWPDAPPIFETEASLRTLWQGPRRVFLLTYVPASRTTDLKPYGPVRAVASAGGKTVLTNQW